MLSVLAKEMLPFIVMKDELQTISFDGVHHLLDFLYKLAVPPPGKKWSSEEEQSSSLSYCSELRWRILKWVSFLFTSFFSTLFKLISRFLPTFVLLKEYMESRFFKARQNEVEDEMEIASVRELRRCGVRFRGAVGGEGVRGVRFERDKGVIWLPKVRIDGSSEVTMRNIVAYEAAAMGEVEPTFGRYTEIMEGMIDDAADIRILREDGVVLNFMRSDGEAADVWNGMGKCIRLRKVQDLDFVVSEINRFYSSLWRVRVRRFALRCAAASWEVVVFVAVFQILIFVTLLQAVWLFRGGVRATR